MANSNSKKPDIIFPENEKLPDTPDTKQKCCFNCRHYVANQKNRSGHCRRLPPIPIMIGLRKNPISGNQTADIRNIWPTMPCDSWCGEFSRLEILQGSE